MVRSSVSKLQTAERAAFGEVGQGGHGLTAYVKFMMFSALIAALNEIADVLKENKNG